MSKASQGSKVFEPVSGNHLRREMKVQNITALDEIYNKEWTKLAATVSANLVKTKRKHGILGFFFGHSVANVYAS